LTSRSKSQSAAQRSNRAIPAGRSRDSELSASAAPHGRPCRLELADPMPRRDRSDAISIGNGSDTGSGIGRPSGPCRPMVGHCLSDVRRTKTFMAFPCGIASALDTQRHPMPDVVDHPMWRGACHRRLGLALASVDGKSKNPPQHNGLPPLCAVVPRPAKATSLEVTTGLVGGPIRPARAAVTPAFPVGASACWRKGQVLRGHQVVR